MINDWSDDIEIYLNKIRINSIYHSETHKKRFFNLEKKIKFFKIPIIVISSINSVISIGLINYINNNLLSSITCVLSLSVSIIGSVELYLNIDKNKDLELSTSKEYYILSIDIFKNLSLYRDKREFPAKEYLLKIYNDYCSLIQKSNLLMNLDDCDKLIPLEMPDLNTKLLDDIDF